MMVTSSPAKTDTLWLDLEAGSRLSKSTKKNPLTQILVIELLKIKNAAVRQYFTACIITRKMPNPQEEVTQSILGIIEEPLLKKGLVELLNSDEASKTQQKAEKRAVVEALNKIKAESKEGIEPKAEDFMDLAEKAKKLSNVVSASKVLGRISQMLAKGGFADKSKEVACLIPSEVYKQYAALKA